MTQQLDPKQVRGLKDELDTLDSMVKIKSIGANLNLSDEGELSATGGGGGGGGGTLYSTLGQNTDGALTQKASTDLLVHAKPDGTNDLISNNKITLGYLPDSILGQVVYGGGFVPNTAVATLTTNAQDKLGTTSATITLTNDTTAITGYEANEGIYYLATANGTFASISFATGDWLISTGNAWSKVDNTDAVTGVKGNSESTYRLGNVNLTSANIGAIENTTGSVATSNIADNAVTTAKILDSNVTTAKIADSNVTTAKIADSNVTMAKLANTNFVLSDNPGTVTPISPYVNTGDIMDSAVTTAKINDGAVTNAKIGSAAVKASNIDFSTITVAPTPGDLLYTYTTPMTSSQTFTAPNKPCIITGKAVVLGASARACIYRGSTDDLSKLVCGLPYAQGQSNMQVAFTFFAKANETFYAQIESGQIEAMTAYEIDWS